MSSKINTLVGHYKYNISLEKREMVVQLRRLKRKCYEWDKDKFIFSSISFLGDKLKKERALRLMPDEKILPGYLFEMKFEGYFDNQSKWRGIGNSKNQYSMYDL